MSESIPPSGRAVAITGATGLVGAALSQSFGADGWKVLRVSRSAKGSDVVRWNPERGELDAERLEGVDAVIHLAGESIAGRWTAARKERIRQSRISGTSLIAGALAGLERPPNVLISASAVGYYGDRGEDRLQEEAPPGEGFLADVCIAWEASAAPAANAGIRVVHPRIGIVLAAEGGALSVMKTPFKLGLGGKIGSGRQLMSWVHLEDLVRMIRFAVDDETLSGPFNAVAPEPVTNAEFTRTLGNVLSRPTVLPLPAGVAKLALGEAADEMLLASTGALPGDLEDHGFAWSHSELREALANLC